MKFDKKIVSVLSLLAALFFIPTACFIARSPVIILSDGSFSVLYGEKRMRAETFRNSLSLFRRVITVTVADDSGEDIVPHAVTEVSSDPYCVIFPLRFTGSARLYKDKNPGIPVILLEGRNSGNVTGFEFSYKTDLDMDFQKAGQAALHIASGGKTAVFLESSVERQAKEAFLRGLGEENASNAHFYTNFSYFNPIPDLSCAVLAGIGGEFMEENAGIPVIFMSWLDPALLPSNVVMLLNDSPQAQVLEAVRLFSTGEKEGRIGSKIVVLKGKNIDKKILRKIRKIG